MITDRPIVVGLIGRKNSGKGTAAKIFEQRGLKPYAFADPIKEIVHDIFGISREVLWGPSENRTREVRQMLQHLGTDFARKFNPDIWAHKLVEKLEAENPLPGAVITDVRFPNEAELIKYRLQGILIEINRPTNYDISDSVDNHVSESAVSFIAKHLIQFTVENNQSLEQFNSIITQIADEILNDPTPR